MARARNIKPSIFKNEILGVADPLLTILFESLWCLADKEGRLEDRPVRIKGETFPYRDGVDVDKMLTDLERLGFIVRYQVNELRLIQVINFVKHQKPHHTEKDSELPEFSYGCHVTVKNPLEHGENPSHNALIPDSLLLIPDSPNTATRREGENKKPVSLPTSVEFEINIWLDAILPLIGAKDRKTMANPRGWRSAVEKAVKEGHDLGDFLAAVKSEATRNKGTPQFFTPEGALKVLQLGQIKTNNGFTH